mmetsp:Transcript_41466/g.96114  ORF Transcript_41466/g.96114 Transcript_41466/m.96114 type:complete len:229 (-) Transcript_41466:92-778(-)
MFKNTGDSPPARTMELSTPMAIAFSTMTQPMEKANAGVETIRVQNILVPDCGATEFFALKESYRWKSCARRPREGVGGSVRLPLLSEFSIQNAGSPPLRSLSNLSCLSCLSDFSFVPARPGTTSDSPPSHAPGTACPSDCPGSCTPGTACPSNCPSLGAHDTVCPNDRPPLRAPVTVGPNDCPPSQTPAMSRHRHRDWGWFCTLLSGLADTTSLSTSRPSGLRNGSLS